MNNAILILLLLCLVCLIVGIAEPTLVIRWGKSRNRINAIVTYGLSAIILFILFGITLPKTQAERYESKAVNTDVKQESTTDEQKVAEDKQKEIEKQKEEREKIKEMEDKYEIILSESKDYANMTDEEGVTATEMVANWSKLSTEYKDKYKDSKAAISDSINAYNAKKKAEEEAAKKAEEEAKKAQEEEAKKAAEAAKKAEEEASYNTGITYDNLARTPDEYKGQKVKFTGKVIQVIEGTSENTLRIELDNDYNKVIIVGYKPSIASKRVLENDSVTIKGTSIGIYTYKSTLGGNISIPGIYVNEITIN